MIIDPGKPTAGTAASAVAIKDGDMRSFADDVLSASMSVPVIVDFWAPWCGPCKTLTPLLERLVREAGGRVKLVKINVDQNQELAAQLRIQSVPTVYAFVDGRPIDAFAGAQSESKVRAFIDRLLRSDGSPLDELIAFAQDAAAEGNFAEAEQLCGQVLSQDPRNPQALAGMIRARLGSGNAAGARAVVKGLPSDLLTQADIASAVTAVDLWEQSKRSGGDVAELKRRLQAAPDDHAARFSLSTALFAKGLTEAAVDELLTIVRADRTWNEDAARKQLLRIFEALGPVHPLTLASRRRLSSILFS